MKVAVILVAGAQAFTCGYDTSWTRPCKLDEWINENWWASAVETFNSASDNWEQFADVVQSTDPVVFRQLFNWFDSNDDSEVSVEELKQFEFLRTTGYKFFDKYWHIFDTDNSGTLNFEESIYTITGITDVFARLIIKYFDENGNGILDGQETVNWNKAVEQALNFSVGPEFPFHSEVMAALKRAHADS